VSGQHFVKPVAYSPAIEATPEDDILRQDAGSQDVLFTATKEKSFLCLSLLLQIFFSNY
jgi:hypothetical protein